MSRSFQNVSIENLRGASDHLYYEIWMLYETGKRLRERNVDTPTRNALLESFISHGRILLSFFYTGSTTEDDVLAVHYFDDPMSWKNKRPKMSESLKLIEKRAGKEMAHLSYKRLIVTREEKPWPFVDILRSFHGIIQIFQSCIPRERVVPKFFELTQQLRTQYQFSKEQVR